MIYRDYDVHTFSCYYFNLLNHSMTLLISAADSSSFPSALQPTNSSLTAMSLNSKSFPCVPTSIFFLPDLPPSMPCRAADWLFLTSVLCGDHVRAVAKQQLKSTYISASSSLLMVSQLLARSKSVKKIILYTRFYAPSQYLACCRQSVEEYVCDAKRPVNHTAMLQHPDTLL